MKIKLFNRYGANLYLEQVSNSSFWNLKVDEPHSYVLKYIRVIGDYSNHIEAVDPSGGPFISIGDIFENYKVDEIINSTTFIMSKNGNNK